MSEIYPMRHPDALRLRRRHRIRRLVLLLTAAIVVPSVLLTSPRWTRNVRTRLAMEAVRRECMNYTRGSDRVVYEDDPIRMRKLMKADERYESAVFARSPNGRANVIEPVDCVQRLLTLGDSGYNQIAIPVFVHGRRVGKSAERLVIFTISNRESPANDHVSIELHSAIVRPIYALYLPELLEQTFRLEFAVDAETSVRFYSGQHDPNDPARFSVRYRCGGDEGIVEGMLNDNDTITLKNPGGPGRLAIVATK